MAVGKIDFPVMYPVAGFTLAGVAAGIKKSGNKDLVLMACCDGARTSGVFTQNAFCAAPVTIAKQHLQANSPKLFITNSGNANAGTGQPGFDAAMDVCRELASQSNAEAESVLPFSTGVIGELLPADKINQALPALVNNLSEDNWLAAAEGIMTTDTVPKGSSRKIELGGQAVTITGIAKGSGMIKPNMATMLGYIATDMAIEQADLDGLLTAATNVSFNRITVDGDTSTNDSVVLVATGKGANYAELSSDDQQLFAENLNQVFTELAQLIIRDAEGATKFVSVSVTGGLDSAECLQVAYTIAESPLVKTALFASDPNWGRILAAVGRAGIAELDVAAITIYLDDVLIVENGGRAASYTEQQGQAVMDQQDITIGVVLGRGEAKETIWTSDLSHDYVKINAEYRT